MMPSPKKKFILSLPFVLIVYFILGILYIYFTPLWNPPDEERHFAYCQFIAKNHTLPRFTPEFDETGVYMAFHPPLYYLIGSLFCSSVSPPVEEEIQINPLPGPITLLHPLDKVLALSENVRSAYLLRLLSLLIGAFTIYCVYQSGLLIFRGKQDIAIVACLLVGMNPEFMHISASISNENLNTALSTAFIFFLLRYLREGPSTRHAIALGLLLGCVLITKTSSFFLVPLTLCFFVYLLIKGSKHAGRHILLIVFFTAGLGAWWYIRNLIVYNDPFFTKTIMLAQSWGIRPTLPSLSDIKVIFEKTFISYFGFFGGQKVPLNWPHLLCYGALMLLSGAGLIRSLFKPGIQKHDLPLLLVLATTLLGGLSIFVLLNAKYFGVYQGRYLFVVIGPIAILAGIGLQNLLPSKRRNMLLSCIATGLILLNASALFFVLRPSYTTPRLELALQQEFFDSPSPAINQHQGIGQSFISPADNLCGIEILFATMNTRPSRKLCFTLSEHQTDEVLLHTINFRTEETADFLKYYFVFPPIQESRGKQYRFRIYAQEPCLSEKNTIGMWHTRRNIYPDGTMLINEEKADGDLYFKLYCFIGDKPSSKLEGQTPCALRQGLYLDIWELQLYQQRSKEFRERTHTHTKLMRLQAAYEKRPH